MMTITGAQLGQLMFALAAADADRPLTRSYAAGIACHLGIRQRHPMQAWEQLRALAAARGVPGPQARDALGAAAATLVRGIARAQLLRRLPPDVAPSAREAVLDRMLPRAVLAAARHGLVQVAANCLARTTPHEYARTWADPLRAMQGLPAFADLRNAARALVVAAAAAARARALCLPRDAAALEHPRPRAAAGGLAAARAVLQNLDGGVRDSVV